MSSTRRPYRDAAGKTLTDEIAEALGEAIDAFRQSFLA